MIRIKLIRQGAKAPAYATTGSACRDVYLPEVTAMLPYSITKVGLGFAVEIPYGYEMQLRQRSGLSIKFPNYIANGLPTIDSDFRGEVCLLFVNNTGDVLNFQKHDRICQCVVKEATPFDWVEVDELDDTVRGSGGFGSTNLREV